MKQKSKLEIFARENNCEIDICINRNNTTVYIYRKGVTYAEGYGSEYLEDAINDAIEAFNIRTANELYNKRN